MAAKLGGKKGGKYNVGQNSDINVTPFVDVMLVLLIIFMTTIPPAVASIKIDMPPAINTPDTKTKPTYLSLQEDGRIILVDQGVNESTSLGTLDADLQRALRVPDPQDQTILIRADRLVKYKTFMGVVDQLQTDGYYKVAIISENLSL